MDNNELLLNMQNITIEFPGVKALDNVEFNLKKGEVHVLLGENGAGKSTLMKILAGVYHRTSGTVIYKGNEVEYSSPRQAMSAGITTVYQELNLLAELSVAENIYVGRQQKSGGLISWNKMYIEAKEILDRLGVNISPRAIIKTLTVGSQQMVEIAKAISMDSDIIVMDEPTSALTETEIDELFNAIERLKDEGCGIIYISHRLDEIKKIGDRATILRDGKYIKTVNVKDVSIDNIITMMVGRTLDEKYPKHDAELGEEILRAENVSTKNKVKNCSFNLHKGEMLCFSGLMGAGRTELMRAITGADKMHIGDVYLYDKKTHIRKFSDAVKKGIGMLTEDRKNFGLILNMQVKENISLVSLEKVMIARMFINYKKEAKVANDYRRKIGIKTPSLKQKAVFLSGGNQQKVVLAKWLFADCKVVIFDEPTRGIDVGAKVEIYKLMNQLVEEGIGVIMISSELPEILGMADRIYVMHEGEIVGEMLRKDATQEKIIYLASGEEIN